LDKTTKLPILFGVDCKKSKMLGEKVNCRFLSLQLKANPITVTVMAYIGGDSS
jgi:hypothetical protein